MMMSYRANRTHTRHRPRHNQQLNHVRHEKKKNKGEDKDSVAAYQNDLLRQQRTSKRPRSMNILLVGHVDTCWLHISSHHILFDTSYHTPFQPPFNPTLNPPLNPTLNPPLNPPSTPSYYIHQVGHIDFRMYLLRQRAQKAMQNGFTDQITQVLHPGLTRPSTCPIDTHTQLINTHPSTPPFYSSD